MVNDARTSKNVYFYSGITVELNIKRYYIFVLKYQKIEQLFKDECALISYFNIFLFLIIRLVTMVSLMRLLMVFYTISTATVFPCKTVVLVSLYVR